MDTKFLETLNSEAGYVVLDTETTGLDNAEICQIAVVSSTGEVLLDTLVKPVNPIPQAATDVHGITNDMVKDAPGWVSVYPKLLSILKGQTCVVWNAPFDRGIIDSANEHSKLPWPDWDDLKTEWVCAMRPFAELYGDWNNYRKSYRWQTLTTASKYYKLEVTNAHSALGDVLMTIAVCQKMAQEKVKS